MIMKAYRQLDMFSSKHIDVGVHDHLNDVNIEMYDHQNIEMYDHQNMGT